MPKIIPGDEQEAPEQRYASMIRQDIRFCEALHAAHPEIPFPAVCTVPGTDQPIALGRI